MGSPDDAVEVMPRAPRSHRPALPDLSAADLISRQLRTATQLHEQFLAALTLGVPRPGHGGDLTGDGEGDVYTVGVDDWHLDRAGRLSPGHLVDRLLARLTSETAIIDCEMVFHRDLPVPGDELRSRMRVSGSAVDGTVTEWVTIHGTSVGSIALTPPADIQDSGFDATAIQAFADGRPADCFPGKRWERTRTHLRSPGPGPRRLLLLESISAFDLQRGLIARGRELPDTWSPPAALLQGCWQALTFQLAATGHAIHRDGWRYEPVPGAAARIRFYPHIPGGVPNYRLIVRSMTDTTAHADVFCTIGDQTVLHAQGIAIRLVFDTPLPYWRLLAAPAVQRSGDPVPLRALAGLRGHDDARAVTVGGIRYDHATLLASAWGPMSDVLPDAAQTAFRMPGPPFLFISRLTGISADLGQPRPGSSLIAEYDVPEQVWYREQSGTIPAAAMLEIALQPCGFLASYLVSGTDDENSRVRNLGGQLSTVTPIDVRTRGFRTKAEFSGLERWNDTAVATFRFECEADGALALAGTVTFALTSDEKLSTQVGLPVADAERAMLLASCDRPIIDLRSRPARYFGHSARLPGPMLLMLDRITGYWPDGGSAGLGRLRAELDVRSDAWYFKAHFFNDPVQPGSLGVEAMCQLLCCYLIERGVGDAFRFQSMVPDTWTYRGQVVPEDATVTIELDVTRVDLGPDGGYAEADSRLWVNGRKIYHVPRLQIRVLPGAPGSPAVVDIVLDPASDPWLADHCPTWTVPALPLMSTADLLARAASDHAGRPVRVLRDLQLQRWLPVTGPTRLRVRCSDHEAQLAVWHEAAGLSRFVPAAAARVEFHLPRRPERFAPLPDLVDSPDPYEAAELFHGPSFQYLSTMSMCATGSAGVLDPGRGTVPHGYWHQGLLDAALHTIPHTAPNRWDPEIEPGCLIFPHRLVELAVFDPLPDHGQLDVEARYAGRPADDLFAVNVQLCRGDQVLVALTIILQIVSVGPWAGISAAARRAYLRDGEPDPRFLLTGADGILRRADVESFDVPSGAANVVYGLPTRTRAVDWLPHIAAKEHIARAANVHPRTVDVVDLDNVSWDDNHAVVRNP